MNPNQHPFFGGQAPFVGIGSNILGMNVPQVLEGVSSPQELIELLAIANEFKLSGVSIKALQEKASRVDVLRMQLEKVLEANENLAGRIGQLEDELDAATYVAPQYPLDFTHYFSKNPLLVDDVQALIDEAAETEYAFGEFKCITLGDIAAIRMNDGEKIVTMVAKDFYESFEPIASHIGDCLHIGDCVRNCSGCK